MNISNSKKELARIISENGGWRDFAKFYAQDGSGEIWSYAGKPKYGKDVYGFTGDEIDVEIRASTINNFHQTILSREEYFHLHPAPDADGWIEWNGGECPVDEGVIVDLKWSDGFEPKAAKPRAFRWQHIDSQNNIIAYRLHKPDQEQTEQAKPEFCESVTRSIPEPEAKQTIEQLAADYRNRKDYADSKQAEADAAKADADEALRKLELAGEAIGLIVTPVMVEQYPELVITDWRDLKVGDEIEYVDGALTYMFGITGNVVDFDEHDSEKPVRIHSRNLKGVHQAWPRKWRFIRRP